MSATLHLTVTTPAQILVDSGDVAAVRAEDQSGSFGILPGHADLLTVLVPSVVRWRSADGATRYCAVRGGVFTVSAGRKVAVACREGVVGDSLDDLEAKVRAVRAGNSKPTARRGSNRSAFMPRPSVSSCAICAPTRIGPHP